MFICITAEAAFCYQASADISFGYDATITSSCEEDVKGEWSICEGEVPGINGRKKSAAISDALMKRGKCQKIEITVFRTDSLLHSRLDWLNPGPYYPRLGPCCLRRGHYHLLHCCALPGGRASSSPFPG